MKSNLKKLSLFIGTIIICIAMVTGCSKKDEIKDAFNVYKDVWIKQDFKSMYDMLSTDSKSYIGEEEFLERYNNIYGAIEASNMDIQIVGEKERDKKSLEIPFTMTMNTMVGKIELKDFEATLVKEDNAYKIKWNESLIFPQMQPEDKVRVDDYYAKRGSILDRNGNFLAQDDMVKSIGIHPSKFENEKVAKIKSMAAILDISESYIEEQLAANTNPEHLVPIVSVLKYDSEKLNNLSGIEGIQINNKNSRVYTGGESIGNLIGYVSPITAEELENNKDKGYSHTSLIGKAGIEKVYEDTLRGQDGGEIYIERGEEKISIAKTEAKNGQDIKLSIDPELQAKIYSEMKGKKGASTAVDPKTGEVLAMVSSPSYDPNVFVTYKTKTIKEQWEKLDGEQFDNRFNNVYAPGSTMKLVTAAIGLDEGVLNPEEGMDIKGLEWQKDASWGGYKITRVKDPGKDINLRDAVKYSDNIYFARVALNIGEDAFINGAKNFGIGEEITFEYPMESSQISNDKTLSKEILLADTGYGQGEVLMSPLDVALAYSALGNNGDIMQPRLNVGENGEAKVWKSAIKAEKVPALVDAFSAVINDADGTAANAKVDGFNIAGKTGTSEIKKDQKDESGKENGWFVAVNTDDSKIAISMIIEDVKDRGGSSIPTAMVKNVMEYYLKK
ncbi:penicillin-binding transpeptidase domain-containing protein [Clostridium sp. UBA1056]|uniref:penicillin-binding transpeptidase domain-containing protein n=1 Tax=unclassified Clostridium TaxID=2614128 RepID=UPI0032172EBC